MKKIMIAVLVTFCFLGLTSIASAAFIDASYDSNGGSVVTFVKTDDAYSEFQGNGHFKGTFQAETKHLCEYNGAPWADAESSDVIDTEIHANTKAAKGATFSYYGEQEFQKGKASDNNLAAVAMLSASGDKADMNVGFQNTENRATIRGYDHESIVRGEATKSWHGFSVSMALFNIDANKLGWSNPISDRANNYVASEGTSTDGIGSVELYKTKWGQGAVAATGGHTSEGTVDFYDNNNVVGNNNGAWQAYNDDVKPVFYSDFTTGMHFHANYGLSS
jgi:hypothetical protein